MKVSHRDIIEVIFAGKPHPALVISNEYVLLAEGTFFAVMISHNIKPEEFAFELKDQMRTKPAKDSRPSYILNAK